MQIIKPSLLSRLFTLASFETIIFDKSKIVIGFKNKIITIAIEDIQNYTIKKSFLKNIFLINLKNREKHTIKGFPSSAIHKFRKEFDAYFAISYYEHYYHAAQKICEDIPSKENYWRKKTFQALSQKTKYDFHNYRQLKIAPSLQQQIKFATISSLLSENDNFRLRHNNIFIASEKKLYENYFNSVESNPLTERQKDAVITYEKNTLVLAGAGSGKTSVMVAKAGYLVQKYNIDPKNILLLAFNKKAKSELKERIEEKLNMQMDSLTFHALGMSIIAEVEDVKPSLGSWAEDDRKMTTLMQKLINEILSKDEKFSKIFIEYFQTQFFKYESAFDFETYGEYIDYIKSVELRSLNGDRVKSYEECEIANFLFLNQIAYQYEKPYEYDTKSRDYQQYRPDFYLSDYGIYIEHFGIDKDGHTAPYVNKTLYHEGMVWKRALHRHYGTLLLETYSCEKQKGLLTSRLQEKLARYGVESKPLSTKDALVLLNQNGMTNAFTRLCATFLSNYKSNNHTIDGLKDKAKSLKYSERSFAFLELFEKIYLEYENFQDSQGMIDFNDMINKAVLYIKSGRYGSRYTHILVDEFQDISSSRAEMVRQLALQNNASLCVVGDDWQSINRFAGSDISIIRNFTAIFGDSETINLDYTFRFNNKISHISQAFIESNPNQLSKNIKTIKETEDKAIFIWWNVENIVHSLSSMLDTISQKRPNESLSLLVLARFWHSIPNEIKSLNTMYPNIEITTLSVHASKGLEADYVVVLENEAGKFGFPSSIEDDPIIDLVLAESEEYDFAEERRLFYVAMTRAKDEVHFFASLSNRSLFIDELLKNNKSDIIEIGSLAEEQEQCIKCTTGKLVKRKTKKTGKLFLACLNYPYCDNTKAIVHCKKCEQGSMIKEKPLGLYKCSNSLCDANLPMCKDCDTVMIERKGKFGLFYGCSNYPICDYTQKITG